MGKAESRKQLGLDEGVRKAAYRDHLGYLTIGIGRLIDARKGGGLSPEEIAYLFENDLKERERQLDVRCPWWRNLSDARQGVLINMCFQLGIGGLMNFPAMHAAIKLGRWGEAADEMLDSLWAKQTPERAERLAFQMRHDVWRFDGDGVTEA